MFVHDLSGEALGSLLGQHYVWGIPYKVEHWTCSGTFVGMHLCKIVVYIPKTRMLKTQPVMSITHLLSNQWSCSELESGVEMATAIPLEVKAEMQDIDAVLEDATSSQVGP